MGGAGEDFREKPRLDNVLRGVLQFAAGSIAAKPVVGGLEEGIERGFAAIRCAAGGAGQAGWEVGVVKRGDAKADPGSPKKTRVGYG